MFKIVRIVMCLALLAAPMTLSGCIFIHEMQVDSTRENLDRLRLGMTSQEARDVMGTPWKVDRYISGNSKIEVLYYKTQIIRNSETEEEEMTPIFLKDGKVIGWGNRFVYVEG